MGIEALLNKGRPERGVLEKFADACNFLPRAFWLGRTVTSSKKDDTNLIVDTVYATKSISARWLAGIGEAFFIDPFGPILGPLTALGYAIACIPVGLAAGIGLIAKKIALAVDDKSKRYTNFVQKALNYSEEKMELKPLNKGIDLKVAQLGLILQRKQKAEEVQISEAQSPELFQHKKRLLEDSDAGIKIVTAEIEGLEKQRDKILEKDEKIMAELKKAEADAFGESVSVTVQIKY
jgi:hypothetical protein